MEAVVMQFDEVGRLPLPGDNVAIATRKLAAGTVIERGGARLTLNRTVLEGHRFAIEPIGAGEPLLSWELPFGTALRDLAPGDYVCNEKLLADLRIRPLDFELPAEPNFRDARATFTLDEAGFQPAEPVTVYADQGTFEGFPRPGNRGVGTRNFIVVLGTTSRTGAMARAIASRCQSLAQGMANLDGIVPVAHTEGGEPTKPNNLEVTLRTLAGFIVHPNVGAVLLIDDGASYLTNAMLRDYLVARGYPLGQVLHGFLGLTGVATEDFAQAESVIREWVPRVNALARSTQPLSALVIGQQCGGSDAFSGVSGNPLSGWVTRELIRHGGAANLAETTELIGAESYVLARVKDAETARGFLAMIERYEELARWHGQSAEGNPSGGNLYRGLYNIVLKSIGAAMKKHPEVRLEGVLDYGQRVPGPGYWFMDSAGNDLESIAGQVASGCNLIHFVTGNGSITNFPFVPTIKIVTTSDRFRLLSDDMDVNAGRYLDGESMDSVGMETFELTVRVASGERSVGEKAGHSQVQLWREWRQTERGHVEAVEAEAARPTGEPLPLAGKSGHGVPASATQSSLAAGQSPSLQGYRRSDGRFARERIALIAPTSLCAGQVARMIAERLNASPKPAEIDRFVALPHTEGCGTSRGYGEELYLRTLSGYLCHPSVRRALLLEHGCEKTHANEFQRYFREHGIDASSFGAASIQADGGIERVSDKVARWFGDGALGGSAWQPVAGGPGDFMLGWVASRELPAGLERQMEGDIREIVAAGGSVILPRSRSLKGLLASLTGRSDPEATLAYGQRCLRPGLHVMDSPTEDPLEQTTGLGACGAHAVLAWHAGVPLGHPMLPVVSLPESGPAGFMEALHAKIHGKEFANIGMAEIQVTRGLLGISL